MHTGKAAEAVQKALAEHGMSIRELSRRSGVEYHTVRNGVNNITSMNSIHFLRYCLVLGIDIEGVLLNGPTSKENTLLGEESLQERQIIQLKSLAERQMFEE